MAISSHAQRVIEAEILQAVREAGLASLDKVEAMVLETDGTFSVVKTSDKADHHSSLANIAIPPEPAN